MSYCGRQSTTPKRGSELIAQIKTENWNGHEVRVAFINGERWAVLKDITDALELVIQKVRQRLPKEALSTHPIPTTCGAQKMLIVNEIGVYDVIFGSRKKEAGDLRQWAYLVSRGDFLCE